jgi:hypothetical protein
MRGLSSMPPTLRGWRVDLNEDQRHAFDQAFVSDYQISGNPDGSITARHQNGLADIEICPARFDHTDWNHYGAEAPQIGLILNRGRVLISNVEKPDLVRRLQDFGWAVVNYSSGIVLASPPNQELPRFRQMQGTLGAAPIGPVVAASGWSTGLPNSVPGSHVEMRIRPLEGVGNSQHIYEYRSVPDHRPSTSSQYAAYYQQLDPSPVVDYVTNNVGRRPPTGGE